MRILITGAAGRLGQRFANKLGSDHDLVLGDVKPIADRRFIGVDVTDLEAVRAAMKGCNAVVHTAMFDWVSCPEEDLRNGVPGIQVHVAGLHNVLRVALEVGLRRFVYTSSISVVDGLPVNARIDSETRHYSNNIYGQTKGFGEDLCRMFHHNFGLSIAVLRLGTIFVPEAGGAWVGNRFHPDLATCLPQGTAFPRVHVDDVIRAVSLSIKEDAPRYSVTHIVGAGSSERWDLTTSRNAFGWKPRYAFDINGIPYVTQPESV